MCGVRLALVLETLRDLFFPLHCAGCGMAIDRGWLCRSCGDALRPIRPPRCEICSQPFAGGSPSFVCSNCRGRAFHFECAVAAVQSRGMVRDLIHRFKYGRELWLAKPLGEILSRGLADPRLAGRRFDGLVPVPLHPVREREREFNQADLLAREASRRLAAPVLCDLRRLRYTVTQTHFDRRRRMQNLRDAFTLRQNAGVQGKTLLLVDDVLTTGSTLDECARVLLEAGARSISAVTVARA